MSDLELLASQPQKLTLYDQDAYQAEEVIWAAYNRLSQRERDAGALPVVIFHFGWTPIPMQILQFEMQFGQPVYRLKITFTNNTGKYK